MLAYDYGRLVVTSQRLLKKFGQQGQLVRMVPGNGPKHNPGAPTPDATPAHFAVLEYEVSELDGTRITKDHRKVLMAPGAVAPAPGMHLIDAAGKQLPIIQADPLAPAGTVVLWTLQVLKQ